MNFALASVIEKSTDSIQIGAWDSVLSAGPVVKFTLLILVSMSIFSWAIIFTKKRIFTATKEANEPFLSVFWKASSLDDISDTIDDHPESSLAQVFKAGYLELRKIADSNLATNNETGKSPMLSGLDNLERALQKATDHEIGIMESRLNFLATTGSTGPFIGLFGTVWGIMGAFQKIGATSSASLAVVAPGISEALVATAIGLAAAIPATVAYNHFTNEIRRQEIDLSSFAADFLNIAKRNFFKDQ